MSQLADLRAPQSKTSTASNSSPPPLLPQQLLWLSSFLFLAYEITGQRSTDRMSGKVQWQQLVPRLQLHKNCIIVWPSGPKKNPTTVQSAFKIAKWRRLLLIKLFCLFATIEINAEVLRSASHEVLPHEGMNVLGPDQPKTCNYKEASQGLPTPGLAGWPPSSHTWAVLEDQLSRASPWCLWLHGMKKITRLCGPEVSRKKGKKQQVKLSSWPRSQECLKMCQKYS